MAVQNEPNDNVGNTEIVTDTTSTTPDAVSESGLKRINVNTAEVDNVTDQAVALNGGGIQNITVNNLIDENSTASDGKPQSVFKGGIVGTSTVRIVDAKEKALIENEVILTGNGVADTPFVADDIVDNNSTQSNVGNKSTIVTGTAQFGKDIQARATDDTTEKSNKTVSIEENERTKVVKVSNFNFEANLDNHNGINKLVSVNVAMKNNQTSTIIFQFPINIYVDHVNKKTGFITRLKHVESSTVTDAYIANKIRKLIKKSKENIEEEGKTTENSSLTQKPEQLKVALLRNK